MNALELHGLEKHYRILRWGPLIWNCPAAQSAG